MMTVENVLVMEMMMMSEGVRPLDVGVELKSLEAQSTPPTPGVSNVDIELDPNSADSGANGSAAPERRSLID